MSSRLKKRFPALIRYVEKTSRRKFKKRPTLIFKKRGYPKNELTGYYEGRGKNERLVKVIHHRTIISKPMARNHPKIAQLAVLHELRESLARQHNVSDDISHKRANKRERRDANFLGIDNYGPQKVWKKAFPRSTGKWF